MNKCISLAVPLRATTGKRSVHREKWHPRKRAYISSATTNKTLFPGENTRARNGRERGGSSVHSIPGIPGAAIQAAELAEKYGRNVALTRESSAIHCRRPWILMDLSSPPPPRGKLSPGTMPICIMQFTRAHSFKIYTWLHVLAKDESCLAAYASSFLSLFSSSLYVLLSPQFAVPLARYGCV